MQINSAILGAQYMIYISHIQAGYFSKEITKKKGEIGKLFE